jgi:hypothetical protein
MGHKVETELTSKAGNEYRVTKETERGGTGLCTVTIVSLSKLTNNETERLCDALRNVDEYEYDRNTTITDWS